MSDNSIQELENKHTNYYNKYSELYNIIIDIFKKYNLDKTKNADILVRYIDYNICYKNIKLLKQAIIHAHKLKEKLDLNSALYQAIGYQVIDYTIMINILTYLISNRKNQALELIENEVNKFNQLLKDLEDLPKVPNTTPYKTLPKVNSKMYG